MPPFSLKTIKTGDPKMVLTACYFAVSEHLPG
jgi:uncharacterized membrane protein